MSEIFYIIAPVFVIAAIGYAIEKYSSGFDTDTLSRLAMWIGTPSLVFYSLTNTELPNEQLAGTMLVGLAVVVVGGLLSTLGLWILKLPLRSFLPALSLPNSGNAGLPIVYFAFPEDGLTIGVAFFFMIALVQYTVVPAVVAGHFSLRKLAAEPLIWSIAAVVLLKLIDVSPHRIIADTTRLLSGIMIPVMLILLGGALARLRVADLKLSLTLSGLRFIVGIAAGYGVIVAMDLQGIEAGAIFLLAAMPSALVTYVFAERYGRDPERVAGMVVSSTVLTFAALPILVALALNIAGQ